MNSPGFSFYFACYVDVRIGHQVSFYCFWLRLFKTQKSFREFHQFFRFMLSYTDLSQLWIEVKKPCFPKQSGIYICNPQCHDMESSVCQEVWVWGCNTFSPPASSGISVDGCLCCLLSRAHHTAPSAGHAPQETDWSQAQCMGDSGNLFLSLSPHWEIDPRHNELSSSPIDKGARGNS